MGTQEKLRYEKGDNEITIKKPSHLTRFSI